MVFGNWLKTQLIINIAQQNIIHRENRAVILLVNEQAAIFKIINIPGSPPGPALLQGLEEIPGLGLSGAKKEKIF